MKKVILFTISILMVSVSYAQTKIITGTVSDKTGTLPGVSIIIKGTSSGYLTDVDGNYTVEANEGDILQFSYVGMKTKSVIVNSSNSMDVTMKSDLIGLDEIIITGSSGISTKKQLGSAISTINAGDLSDTKATVSVGEALQGKIAGAQVNRNSGNPSGGISVRLRGASTLTGSSDPLYIIDGVIVNNNSNALIDLGGYTQNRLVDINPDDIERMEILKGAAAAAIYGSRASNGVIQIFTKKGKMGKPKITFSTSYNINKLRKKLPYNDAQLMWANDSTNLTTPAKRYDYQDYIFETAQGFENYLNIRGGTNETKYVLSASQYKNGGIVKNTDFNRKTLKLRLDQRLYQWAIISVGSFVSSNISSDMPNGINYGPLTSILFADNLNDPYPDEFGNYSNIGWMVNPVEAIDKIEASTKNFRSLNDVQLKLTPFEGFIFNYSLGYDHSNSEGLLYIPNGFNTKPNGVSEKSTINMDMINSDINTSYRLDISNDLVSTTGLGYSYQHEETKSFKVANNLVSPIKGIIVTDPLSASEGSDSRSQASYWGGYLQQNFGYSDKLFLTLAGRLDGASTFGKEERQQFYPKASASYSISDEDFFINSLGELFNSFKLRTAWGQAGNLTAIGPNRIYTNYNPGIYEGNITFSPSNILGNSTLKPERQTEFEIGFDLSMLDNNLSLEFSYYKQEITDLLINRPLAPSTGFAQQYANIGTMENKGFELLLKATPITNSDFSWDISTTFSINKNVTPYIEGVKQSLGLFGTSVAQSGEPLGAFYGTFFATDANGSKLLTPDGNVQFAKGHYEYKTSSNGQEIPVAVQDYDADGQPTGEKLSKIIGDPNPDFIASITNEFKYKKFGLRFQFDASQGNQVLSWDKRMGYRFAGGKATADELNGTVPKGSSLPNFYIYESFLEDGSYIKLREVALTYSLKIKKDYLDNIKFSVSGTNLISFDNYYGFDPEVNIGGQTNGVIGQDMANVPIPQVYKFGVLFNF